MVHFIFWFSVHTQEYKEFFLNFSFLEFVLNSKIDKLSVDFFGKFINLQTDCSDFQVIAHASLRLGIVRKYRF